MVERGSNPLIASWSGVEAFETLTAEASVLERPMPHERASVLRSEAGLLVDRLLTRVARGRGALDVTLGEGLAALAEGDRALRLGYSGIGDYSRERLGIAARTAHDMARLARELRSRPLLRNAVRSGEVSPRKALAVFAVAWGNDEAAWVARARTETVRALEAAVRTAGRGSDQGRPEEWERVSVPLTEAGSAALDEAMHLAGKILGATAPKWQRLEAICQEFLGAHTFDDRDCDDSGGPLREALSAPRERLEKLKAALEEEYGRWSFLTPIDPVEAPTAPFHGHGDPRQLDSDLRQLAAMRDRWDELVGHLAMLMQTIGLWRDAGFASFAHYCAERLGMSARAVEQRAWLERRLLALPALRQAMREGRLSYEQARLVAGRADGASVGAWMARAEKATCIALRRQIDAEEHAQMCARGELALRAPKPVAGLLAAAFRAARAAAGEWLSPSECLERIARHFVDTWKQILKERRTPQKRAMERDDGRCQVPGCSRAAVHAHHVVYRSHHGGDEDENLTSLCAAHHLHGIHRGFIRVQGRAPDGLLW